MFIKSYLMLSVAICLLTALAHATNVRTPSVFSGGGSSYGHGYGSSSRSSGGYFSGWGGGK
jgi:hypothetical protein